MVYHVFKPLNKIKSRANKTESLSRDLFQPFNYHISSLGYIKETKWGLRWWHLGFRLGFIIQVKSETRVHKKYMWSHTFPKTQFENWEPKVPENAQMCPNISACLKTLKNAFYYFLQQEATIFTFHWSWRKKPFQKHSPYYSR